MIAQRQVLGEAITQAAESPGDQINAMLLDRTVAGRRREHRGIAHLPYGAFAARQVTHFALGAGRLRQFGEHAGGDRVGFGAGCQGEGLAPDLRVLQRQGAQVAGETGVQRGSGVFVLPLQGQHAERPAVAVAELRLEQAVQRH